MSENQPLTAREQAIVEVMSEQMENMRAVIKRLYMLHHERTTLQVSHVGPDVLPYLEPRKDDLHDAMTQAADYVYPPRDGE